MPLDLEAAARYVVSRRTRDGGYCFYRTPQWGVEEPNAPDTLAALESLRLLGARPAEPELTASWLQGLQGENGSYPTFTIGWGSIRALDLLGLAPSHSPRRWLGYWRDTLSASQRPGHDVRAWLLRRLRFLELLCVTHEELDTEARDALVSSLRTVRADHQMWVRAGADLEMVALIVRVHELAGLSQPDGHAVVDFFRHSEDHALGLRLAPHVGTTSVRGLWGGLTLASAYRLRPRYPRAVDESLTRLQRPEGGLGQRDRAISTLQDTWRGLSAAHLLDQITEPRS
jgi:hypothetical protein